MKTGFFSAVAGVVSGTAVFYRLRQQSWGRVIWHLVLFSFILAIATTIGEVSGKLPALQDFEESFVREFGTRLEVGPDGIVPEKSPSKRRFYSPAPGTLLCYLGDSDKVKVDDKTLLGTDALLIWGRKKLATGFRGENGLWQLQISVPDKNRMVRCNESEVVGELNKKVDGRDDSWDWPEFNLYTADLFRAARSFMKIFTFTYRFGAMVSLPWLYTGVFVLITMIFGNRQYRNLGLKGLWKCGIYAGFPAMIVGAAFPAFGLPYLDYSTVYMAGLIIYWMIAAMRTEYELIRGSASAEDNGEENHE